MTNRLGVLGETAYRRFWLGESISVLGSQVTELALPLTAVLLLQATPAEMGLLTAIGFSPFLLFGLLAGVWADRFRRRRILISTDLVSALAVILVPVAAVGHVLAMPVLYLAGFVLGTKEVLARVASQSFIPTLVGRERLVEANARLEASTSVAIIAGPGLGGILVQVLTAPIALVVDALSYLVSATLLGSIRVEEPVARDRPAGSSIRAEIADGLRLVLGTPVLRALTTGGAIHNFFSRMTDALFVLYAVDVVRLSPAEIGLVFAAVGPGALVGAVVVGRLDRWIGVGPSLAWLQVLTGVSRLMIPLAIGPGAGSLALLVASNFLLGLVRTAFNVSQVSLRVAMTPDHLHGRLNATIRFLMWSVTPFGALAGGLLASTGLGLVGTFWIAGFGVLAAFVPFLQRPLRTIRRIPEAAA
jgi:MFS family permease